MLKTNVDDEMHAPKSNISQLAHNPVSISYSIGSFDTYLEFVDEVPIDFCAIFTNIEIPFFEYEYDFIWVSISEFIEHVFHNREYAFLDGYSVIHLHLDKFNFTMSQPFEFVFMMMQISSEMRSIRPSSSC